VVNFESRKHCLAVHIGGLNTEGKISPRDVWMTHSSGLALVAGYVAELTKSPRVQTRAEAASTSLSDVRRTRSAVRAVDQNDRNTRRTSLGTILYIYTIL